MKREKPVLSGELLVADFQNAFVSAATAEYAKQSAAQSENDLLNQLSYWSGGNYLNPGNIDANVQQDVSRASLDAHVKKVQAQQLESLSLAQLSALITEDNKVYKGKKVVIEAIHSEIKPIDAVWFNPRTGYRSNTIQKSSVTGTIQEVALDKNVLILKPKMLPRMINKEFQAYFVYIIDPRTAQPMVRISLT